MRLPFRALRLVFSVATVVAVAGFASTIDVRLWGHPWAERAQDVAMFGGLGAMVLSGIPLLLATKRKNRV